MIRKRCTTAALLLLFCASEQSDAQPYYPKTGPEELRTQALELRNNLNILMIALRPGDEDFAGLATFRLWKGASVLSLYVTNGEALQSTDGFEYPPMLAARRRAEAQKAMEMIGCGVQFLNMPDLAAARDTADVYEYWDADTLEIRLMRVLSAFRPDVILLNAPKKPEILVALLQSHVLAAVRRIASPSSLQDLSKIGGLTPWNVNRVFSADSSGTSTGKAALHPLFKKSAEAIGMESSRQYTSLSLGLTHQRSYETLLPAGRKFRTLDQGLPRASGFRGIEKLVNTIADRILKEYKVLSNQRRKREELLARATAAIDSLDTRIRESLPQVAAVDRRAIIHWKEKLQSVRNRLLGVKVFFSLSDEILTSRQVTYLKIDSISGINKTGRTFLFFPFAKQGWIVDERYNNERVEYVAGKSYEIVSPEYVPVHLPAHTDGLEQHALSWPMLFFVVHDAGSPARNFIERITIPIQFGPKFSVETLTPIVRAIDGERVTLRLTNQSRDGVADFVSIKDSLVGSTASRFRLSSKGSVFQDTLVLQWKRTPPPGDYLLPIDIGGIQVGNVGARSFELEVKRGLSVSLLTGSRRSVVEETLRRCGIRSRRITASDIDSLDVSQVLILDEFTLSLVPDIHTRKKAVEGFLDRGGRVIILRQAASDWNRMSMVPGMRISESFEYTPTDSVMFDASDPLFADPNIIADADWDGWLFARAHQKIVHTVPDLDIPLRAAADGNPLLVVAKRGSGRLTYVNLALSWQWLNIHAGSFRFLANLLSY